MTDAVAFFGAMAVLLVAWSYVGYPGFVSQLARRAPSAEPPEPVSPPAVEVLVSAFDEEAAIGRRVENLLGQQYSGSLTIAVGCDGCTDATAARAKEAGDGRVRVVEFSPRRGKAAVIDDLAQSSRAEVAVFTDANSEFEPDSVARLVAPFADPRVGAVCGRLLLVPSGADGPTPETEFWDLESELKEAEGRLGVCVGANGAIYAARRSLVRPLPPGTVLDDFLIPARIAHDGHRVVFARDAVARERAPSEVAEEVARRLRIGIGAGAVLRREWWLFDVRRRPLLALAFFSRKVARWLAPVAALVALACALLVPDLAPASAALAALLVLLFASVLLRPRVRGLAGRLYYFVVINLALAAGVVAGLAGYSRPAWKRSER